MMSAPQEREGSAIRRNLDEEESNAPAPLEQGFFHSVPTNHY